MRTDSETLSRRERQIMDSIYRLGGGTVADVRAELPDPPSYSAVRAQLGILESKGHLKHRQEGRRYVYVATESAGRASQRALRGLVRTFFGDSTTDAVAALLHLDAGRLSEGELEELASLVHQARQGRS